MTDIADLSVETIVGDPRRPPHRFISTVRNLGPDTARNPNFVLIFISTPTYTVESISATMAYDSGPGHVLPKQFTGVVTLALQWTGDLAAGRSIVVETLVTPGSEPQAIRAVSDISTDSTDPDSANNQHDETWIFPIARRGALPRYGVPVGWASPSPALLG